MHEGRERKFGCLGSRAKALVCEKRYQGKAALKSTHSHIISVMTGFFTSPLPPEAKAFYDENGFLVVEGAFSPAEVAALNKETVRICRGERGEFDGRVETQEGETDDEVVSRYLCIHFPHKI